VIRITLLLKKDGIAINKEGLESAFWQNPVLLAIWFIPELSKGSPPSRLAKPSVNMSNINVNYKILQVEFSRNFRLMQGLGINYVRTAERNLTFGGQVFISQQVGQIEERN